MNSSLLGLCNYLSVLMWLREDSHFVLVLVVVLVLEGLSYAWRILAHPVLVRIKALDQFGEHSHNTDQHFFAGFNSFQKSQTFRHRSIQTGGAFDSRAARIIKEFCPLASLSPPIAFGISPADSRDEDDDEHEDEPLVAATPR